MSGIDLKSCLALKHDLRIERNQRWWPLISSARSDFFIPVIMYALVFRLKYYALKTKSTYKILHFLGMSFYK
jgi:hypothetical protein